MIFISITVFSYLVKAFLKLLLREQICKDVQGLKHDSGTEFHHKDLSVLYIYLQTVH